MSETTALLRDAAHRLFGEHVTPELLKEVESGTWPGKLWDAVEEAGFLDALAELDADPAERTGHARAILKAAARHLAPIPLAETMLVRMLFAQRAVPVPHGPVTFAILDGHTHVHGNHSHLEGTAARVPFARNASHALLAARGAEDAVFISTKRGRLTEGHNIAREPRDELAFADTAGGTIPDVSGEYLEALGATARAMQIAGALERVLLQTVDYARTRVQFGKPIAAFQAIQQQLAILAGQTAAAGMAADAALGDVLSPARLATSAAYAKIRCGEAAGIAASIAHQVHGAIGITYEHSLHFATRRLWSWRAEFGSESQWAARIGGTVARAGRQDYWPSLTAL